jgi:RNA polymerase sigma factor (sigma-70 family)
VVPKALARHVCEGNLKQAGNFGMSQRSQSAAPRATGIERDEGSEAARKRAAVEMIARQGSALKRTARRFSIDAEDAEDAYQRALEIVLTKAPTTSPRDLIRWTQTVIRHEALAVRQGRERLHGYRREGRDDPGFDPVANLAADGGEPDEQVERREEIARSREALKALKPAELRALSLLAEGYSYAEIGELTGFSQTKVNRVLAEGRDRFRRVLTSSEDGSRCQELRPLLSAFCDGEASSREAVVVREHLRACARCRATMRAYRAAPGIAAALVPALPPSRSLLERAQDLLAGLGSRLAGIGGAGEAVAAQVAVASCLAIGALPSPGLVAQREQAAADQRAIVKPAPAAEERHPGRPAAAAPRPRSAAAREEIEKATPEKAVATTETAAAAADEYEPSPTPTSETAATPVPVPVQNVPAPAAPSGGESSGAPSTGGSAAGEFGP